MKAMSLNRVQNYWHRKWPEFPSEVAIARASGCTGSSFWYAVPENRRKQSAR